MAETNATYTVNQVSRLLSWSRQSVIRVFQDEPGVIVLERAEKACKKRRYRTFTIPRAVLGRVLTRLSKGGVIAVHYKRKRVGR